METPNDAELNDTGRMVVTVGRMIETTAKLARYRLLIEAVERTPGELPEEHHRRLAEYSSHVTLAEVEMAGLQETFWDLLNAYFPPLTETT